MNQIYAVAILLILSACAGPNGEGQLAQMDDTCTEEQMTQCNRDYRERVTCDGLCFGKEPDSDAYKQCYKSCIAEWGKCVCACGGFGVGWGGTGTITTVVYRSLLGLERQAKEANPEARGQVLFERFNE